MRKNTKSRERCYGVIFPIYNQNLEYTLFFGDGLLYDLMKLVLEASRKHVSNVVSNDALLCNIAHLKIEIKRK